MIRSYDTEYTNKSTQDGKPIYHYDLYADTAAELADVTTFSNTAIAIGSRALTADGKKCIFDSDGKWHDFSDGTIIVGE